MGKNRVYKEQDKAKATGKVDSMEEKRQRAAMGKNGRPISKKEVKARRRKRKVIMLVVELVILILVLAGLWVMVKMSKIGTDAGFKHAKVENEDLSAETKKILGDYTTIALFGLDNCDGTNYDRGNTDVIMIARIDNDSKEVRLVSIYRDTMLNMTDLDNKDAYSKANAAYAVGGPEQAVRMLNTNLDLNIKEYVSFDFDAVAEAVDILGGVELEISPHEAELMKGYQDEVSGVTGKNADYLTGGVHTLNGVQAVSYARIRYIGNGDFQRTERQRTVLNKMVEKALSSDLGKINELVDAVFPKIKSSLSKMEMLSLVKDGFNYKMGETAGFPSEQVTGSYSVAYQKNDASCVVPVDLAANVEKLHQFLYGTMDYKVTQGVQSISDAIEERTGIKPKEAQ